MASVTQALDDPGFEASEADVLWVWADPQSEEHDFAVRKVLMQAFLAHELR